MYLNILLEKAEWLQVDQLLQTVDKICNDKLVSVNTDLDDTGWNNCTILL